MNKNNETKQLIYIALLETKIRTYLKYMKRQTFHAYTKQKMVNRFNELFEEELK